MLIPSSNPPSSEIATLHHDGTDRERRWMLLAETGTHSWVGRHSDPAAEELQGFGAALAAQGLGGWLCVVEGQYWSDGPLTVLEVRQLADGGEFAEAREIFMSRRREAVAQL